MTTANIITQELVKELFSYDGGELIENTTRGQNKYAIKGNLVGSMSFLGYKVTKINGKAYKVHRLIFLYQNGYLPKFIDHINGNRSDNRIENLREASLHENARNIEKRNGKTSRYKGGFCRGSGIRQWRAALSFEGKTRQLGSFETELEAAMAYNISAIQYFGNFARLNITEKGAA